jgi:hypothetical protein
MSMLIVCGVTFLGDNDDSQKMFGTKFGCFSPGHRGSKPLLAIYMCSAGMVLLQATANTKKVRQEAPNNIVARLAMASAS